jgi:hypothetical protein
MIGMAFVKDWKTMVGMRVLLGIMEVQIIPTIFVWWAFVLMQQAGWFFPELCLLAQYLVQPM